MPPDQPEVAPVGPECVLPVAPCQVSLYFTRCWYLPPSLTLHLRALPFPKERHTQASASLCPLRLSQNAGSGPTALKRQLKALHHDLDEHRQRTPGHSHLHTIRSALLTLPSMSFLFTPLCPGAQHARPTERLAFHLPAWKSTAWPSSRVSSSTPYPRFKPCPTAMLRVSLVRASVQPACHPSNFSRPTLIAQGAEV